MSEAAPRISVTLDLEDHRHGGDNTLRYRDNAQTFLNFVDELGIHATIFIVGDVISDCRELIKSAARQGHEFGLHSVRHTPLTKETAAVLTPLLSQARQELEELTQSAVRGFRAPIFSLTPQSLWAVDALKQAGFEYSSSVLAARNPQFGFPQAPQVPFRWPNGLIEIPVPLGGVGSLRIPFLGGIYLRYLPLWVVRYLNQRLPTQSCRWTYIHPYDLDAAENYFRFPGTSVVESFALWRRRGGTLKQVQQLIDNGQLAGDPLGKVCQQLATRTLPTFHPEVRIEAAS